MNDDSSGQVSAFVADFTAEAAIRGHAGDLATALSQWRDGRPRPFARRAANTAVDTIDSMLADLHAMRSRLVGEIRASDDATGARADALLASTDTLLGDLRDGGTR